jgi:hypothetical protein
MKNVGAGSTFGSCLSTALQLRKPIASGLVFLAWSSKLEEVRTAMFNVQCT